MVWAWPSLVQALSILKGGYYMRDRYTLLIDKQLLKKLKLRAIEEETKLPNLFDHMIRVYLALAGEGNEHHSKGF